MSDAFIIGVACLALGIAMEFFARPTGAMDARVRTRLSQRWSGLTGRAKHYSAKQAVWLARFLALIPIGMGIAFILSAK